MADDEMARMPSFEAVETQNAAWALATPDGQQAVAAAMLRMDADSPWGWGFDVSVYRFDSEGNKWTPGVHRMVYDAQNADELAGSIPWDMEVEAHRIDPDLLHEVGIYKNDYVANGAQRALELSEILETGGLAAAKAALNAAIRHRIDQFGGVQGEDAVTAKAQAERLKGLANDREAFSSLAQRSLSATPGAAPTPASYRNAAEQVVSSYLLVSAGKGTAPEPEQARQPERNSVFVVVPAKIGRDKESVRYFDVPQEDGSLKPLAEVTLPFGTKVGGQDASFYRFVVSANQIDAGGRGGTRSHSILLPDHNRTTGDPWKITLTRDFGARDANGAWQPDKRTITATSAELRECCKAQYHAYRERVQQQTARRESHRQQPARPERNIREDADGIDLDAEMHDAREVSDGMGQPQADRGGIRR